jgi:CRP/FNR family transcriptional regulator
VEKLVTSQDEKIDALSQSRYFTGLDSPILEKLASGMYLGNFSRGEMILWQDEACKGLFILRCGSVKLFKTSPQGRELIVTVLYEGATFNEVPVFDGGDNPINVAALEESQIWVLDPQVVRDIMYQYPQLCKAIVLNLSRNLRNMVNVIEELSFYQVTNRLARLICQTPPEQLVDESGKRLTQDQMAARLGTVREVVARSLRELERCGAIQMKRRQIQIMDEDLLQQWAQGPYQN